MPIPLRGVVRLVLPVEVVGLAQGVAPVVDHPAFWEMSLECLLSLLVLLYG